MKKLLGVCSALLILAVAACGGSKSGGGDGGGENKCGGGGSNAAMDMTIDMYKNGTMKAMYMVACHKDPKAGQYWTVKNNTDMGGYKSEGWTKWQIAAVSPDGAVVEMQSSAAGMDQPVMAFLVDTAKSWEDAAKTGNVKKAWIGKPGEQGIEIKVMEVPKAEGGGTPPPKDYEDKTEDFSNMEQGGGKWSGKKYWYKKNDGSIEMTRWTADNAWFDGVIKTDTKMSSGTMGSWLDKFGEDGKPWLKW